VEGSFRFSLVAEDTFDVVFSQHSVELVIFCMGVRYECHRGQSFVGLGWLCCRFKASSYLLRAVSIILTTIFKTLLMLCGASVLLNQPYVWVLGINAIKVNLLLVLVVCVAGLRAHRICWGLYPLSSSMFSNP
jgi:hypothetical protein